MKISGLQRALPSGSGDPLRTSTQGGSVSGGSESNAILAGDSTNRSAGSDAIQGSSSSLVYTDSDGAYNGTAGTLRYGYLRVGTATTASNVKLVVYSYSGGTWSLLETSSGAAFSANSLMRFTFSGTNQIPSGTKNIQIGWIADGYMNVKVSGNTWTWMERSSGSYSIPPTTIDPSGDSNSGYAQMEIYVANY